MDPWVAATIVAQSVSHARIAQCITNLASRHPAASAAAIASLDLLAPGRTVLGTGHSGTHNLGLASGRVAELAEGVPCLRALLAGQPASWPGSEADGGQTTRTAGE
jgi:5,10-methylenetetrahydromethanopterin reductase